MLVDMIGSSKCRGSLQTIVISNIKLMSKQITVNANKLKLRSTRFKMYKNAFYTKLVPQKKIQVQKHHSPKVEQAQ